MLNKSYRTALIVLLFCWTAFILYGSLVTGDELPSLGWWSWLPYFDKWVHFFFYAGEVTFFLLLLRPKGWPKLWTVLMVVICSGLIELLQEELCGRSGDEWDLLANTLGALSGLWIAPLLDRWIFGPIFSTKKRPKV